jgi:hypothetical protein
VSLVLGRRGVHPRHLVWALHVAAITAATTSATGCLHGVSREPVLVTLKNKAQQKTNKSVCFVNARGFSRGQKIQEGICFTSV